MNKRKTGSRYEELARDYLTALGCQILEQNYRVRSGEIDLIARDGKYLVFVEVKYRRTAGAGFAVEAVDARKQRVIVQTARCYLLRHGYPEDTPCRFDVIGIDGGQVTHIRDAFTG